MTIASVLPRVQIFVKQLGRRLTDDEIRLLLDALGPDTKKRIGELAREIQGQVVR